MTVGKQHDSCATRMKEQNVKSSGTSQHHKGETRNVTRDNNSNGLQGSTKTKHSGGYKIVQTKGEAFFYHSLPLQHKYMDGGRVQFTSA